MILLRSLVRDPDNIRTLPFPHLEHLEYRPVDRTKWIRFVDLRYRRVGLIFFSSSHKGDPPVDPARGGTAGKCDYQSGADRNTKIHCDRLADGAVGCKPYPMLSESIMPCSNVWAAARSIARSVLLLLIPPAATAPAQSAKIILPTDNHALFSGDSAAFYQYVRRDFEGQISNAWEGGQYGFVRNPQRIGTAIVYTRFHEGIDIRPLQRDGNGEPLDVIHAIAAGKVVRCFTRAAEADAGGPGQGAEGNQHRQISE
jgi:hypothetical protein